MTILPCPFCGAVPEYDDEEYFEHDAGGRYGCVAFCCCHGPEVRTHGKPWREWRDAAIAAWNTRVPKVDAKDETTL